MYALMWALLPLMGWSHYTYESFGTSCTVAWTSNELEDVTFVVGLILFCFVVLVTALIFFYNKVQLSLLT